MGDHHVFFHFYQVWEGFLQGILERNFDYPKIQVRDFPFYNKIGKQQQILGRKWVDLAVKLHFIRVSISCYKQSFHAMMTHSLLPSLFN